MISTSPLPASLALAALLLASGPSASFPGVDEGSPLVLAPVQVVTLEDGGVLRGRAVRIEAGHVIAVGAAADPELRAGATVVDGGGGFLIPGLVDAHVHLNPGEEDLLDLWLANGVTTVQSMHGGPHQLALMERVERGELVAPRIVSTGPTTATDRVHTEMDATHHVHAVAGAGFQAVKMYGDGRDSMPLETYRHLVEAAHSAGLRVVGHAPRNLPFQVVLDAGQDSIDHMEEIVYTHEPFQRVLGPYVALQFGRAGFETYPDLPAEAPDVVALLGEEIDELARAVAANGLVVTPTLTTFASIQAATCDGLRERLARPEMRNVHPVFLRQWGPEKNRFRNGGWAQRLDFFSAWLRRSLELQRALVKAFHAAGVPLLTGTDSPFQLVVPGVSLHDELDELVGCGLTPLEALRCATVNAAHALRLEDSGRIAPGARADLVLLGANPLEDVRNARDVRGVVLAGRWLPAEELRAPVERRAAALAAAAGPVGELVDALEERDLEELASRFEGGLADDPVLARWLESEVNALGYRLLREADLDGAMAAFETNVELFPASSNAWDSLAEGHLSGGDRELALELYRKSLELDPANENARRQVAALGE